MTKVDDPIHRYKRSRKRIRNADIPEEDKEPILETLGALNPDTNAVNYYNDKGERETKAYSTLQAYGQALKRVSELSETPLMEYSDATDINNLFDRIRTGEHPDVKDDGYKKSTMSQWQSAVTRFYDYHDDLGIDPEDIVVVRQEKTSVDERDMFTKEEVSEMRDAVSNTRDRCLLELLLNTGQRVRAIQTLRVKDVDPEEGVYYLNTDDLGLKGADKNGSKRPLLGAKRPVYDWLKDHPTGEPDDYLITILPSSANGVAGDMISQDNIRDRLRRITEEAGVDKPPHPHNFRHYFVTVCKRDYGMDESTIKHLIGHGEDSSVMESTYQHLTDEDHIKAAEVAADLREPEEESPLTPQVCPTCNEQLPPNAKACPACGTVFAPDAKAAQDQVNDMVDESKEEADTLEEYKDADKIAEAVNDDPELAAQLMDKLDALSNE